MLTPSVNVPIVWTIIGDRLWPDMAFGSEVPLLLLKLGDQDRPTHHFLAALEDLLLALWTAHVFVAGCLFVFFRNTTTWWSRWKLHIEQSCQNLETNSGATGYLQSERESLSEPWMAPQEQCYTWPNSKKRWRTQGSQHKPPDRPSLLVLKVPPREQGIREIPKPPVSFTRLLKPMKIHSWPI